MRDNKKIVTALDIGSSKIVAVVAEVYKDGSFRVLSQGRADSLGVRDGNVTNIEETQQQVENVNENRFSPEAVHEAVTEAIKKVFNQKAETL